MVFLKIWTMTALLTVAQQGSAGTTRTAVVNIGAVSERYQKTGDLEAAFEQRRVGFNQKLNELRQKVETTKRSLQEELKPGTPEFDERRKQLALSEMEVQWFMDSEGQRIEQDLAISLREIYADIQNVVKAIAEEQGLELVLAVDQLPADSPANTQQARQQIVLQKVVYWHPRTDITDETASRLNAKYKASKPAGANGAAPPYAENGLSHQPSTQTLGSRKP